MCLLWWLVGAFAGCGCGWWYGVRRVLACDLICYSYGGFGRFWCSILVGLVILVGGCCV